MNKPIKSISDEKMKSLIEKYIKESGFSLIEEEVCRKGSCKGCFFASGYICTFSHYDDQLKRVMPEYYV